MKNIIIITIITLMAAFVLPMAKAQEKSSSPDYVADSDEQLSEQQQKLEEELQKLEIEKQNLQKELATLEKSRLSAEKSREQTLELAKKEKAEKDKANKLSDEAKKHKQWAEQWTNSEQFKQWQKDLEKWSQQIQQLHENNDIHNWAVDPENEEEFKQWHQEMQQWQNSDEFKKWQQQMQQWQSQMKDWHKKMQLNTHADADSEPMVIPEINPSPSMPPMPKMLAMPPMPPMPENSMVSINDSELILPQPNIVITPKPAPTVTVTPKVNIPKIEVPVNVSIPVDTIPDTDPIARIKPSDAHVKNEEDDKCVAKKEMDFTTKVEPGTPFVVRNKIGKIILNPSKDKNCTVKALIRATADTADQAQELAEQVSMSTHSSRERFYFEPVKSGDDNWKNLNVDLQITVPSGIAPDISTDVGSIEITNLKEGIKGLTNVGSIKILNVIGDIQLTAKVGDIEFVAHKDLSAKIQAVTSVGSIKSEFPLEINTTDFVSNTAKGVIGSGENNIRLVTEVGKIYITKQARESTDNSLEQSIPTRITTQHSAGTGRHVAAQLSSAVELSGAVRTVQSIEENQEGDRFVIKRTEALKMPLSPGSVLDIANEDGIVTIQGSDTGQCLVNSVFTIKAPSIEAVRKLSKNVNLDTTTVGGKLSLKAVSPRNTPSEHSYAIDLNITVPRNTTLILRNEDGDIRIRNLEGQIQIGAEDGNILCENVVSDIRLVSEDGNIDIKNSQVAKLSVKKEDGNIHCGDINGNCDISLNDGNVTISYADGTTENYTCVVSGEDGNVNINKGSFTECQVKRESGAIKCDNVAGNLVFKLESGMVDVDYADIMPESCSIGVKLDEGNVRLSAPGGMFPADSPSKADKKDDGAEWNTKVNTSGGTRIVSLKVGEGSIKIDKR
ncbi:MAG: DUF4097 family beta strand repeat protein [Sedimentisphaerales bacterium]|nr:DUF4097 family beta strand repeat protein [Sedimentisphaerales bacterium]